MTSYIKLSTKEYPKHYGDMMIDPIGTEDFAEVFDVDPPHFNPEKQKISVGTPIEKEDGWYMTWDIFDLTEQEMLDYNGPSYEQHKLDVIQQYKMRELYGNTE
jgi:hypothetical protein